MITACILYRISPPSVSLTQACPPSVPAVAHSTVDLAGELLSATEITCIKLRSSSVVSHRRAHATLNGAHRAHSADALRACYT